MLNGDFFRIDSHSEGIFGITLLPGCSVYRGHFPGSPVAPGVALLELVRECAAVECATPLELCGLQKCRFTKLLEVGTEVPLSLSLKLTPTEAGWAFSAVLSQDSDTVLAADGQLEKSTQSI